MSVVAPRQHTLMKEQDVILDKDLVGAGGRLRHNSDWVSNGEWLLKKPRLKKTSFLACEDCLERLSKGQLHMYDLEAESFNKLIRQAKNLAKYVVTNHFEIHEDIEYQVFADESGARMLIRRALADGFEMSEVFSPGPKGPAFDAEDKDEMTIAVMAFVPAPPKEGKGGS